MELIKFEGKSLEKLIDVVSKGIGTLYKPRGIRKEAEAEAYRQEVLANAEAKSALIKGEAQIELIKRAKERIVHQEIERQLNIENVVEKSITYLKEDVSEKDVDSDWRTRFFEKAKDISNEDIQDIWAKILAEEVSTPNSISIRTLEVISNLSKLEAQKFETLCSIVLNNNSIFKIHGDSSFERFGTSYNDLMMLRDSGLVHDNDMLNITYPYFKQYDGTMLKMNGNIYRFKNKKDSKEKYTFNHIALTTAGKELCSILKIPTNEEYIKVLIESLSSTYEITLIVHGTNANPS